MKSIRIPTIFLALIIMIVSACSNSEKEFEVKTVDGVVMNPARGVLQEMNTPPLDFELVKTIDLSGIEDPVISSLGYLRRDEAGNFYFFDRNVMKLISVDSEGNLRWAVGQEGKGPGDFENPFGLDIHNNKLYIANVQGSRIDEFDLDGNFIRSADMPKGVQFASLEGIRENGEILMSAANFGTLGADIFTLQLGDTLSVIENISVIELEDDKEYERITMRGDVGLMKDFFTYSFNTSYQFRMYGYDGTLKAEVAREFNGITAPGIYREGNSISMYSLGGIGSPIFLDDGKYLMNVRYPTNIKDPNAYAKRASTGETESPIYEEFMDLYNKNNVLLYTFDDSEFVESLGNLSLKDEDGYYYSAFSSNLVIKKYDIKTSANEMEPEEFDIAPSK